MKLETNPTKKYQTVINKVTDDTKVTLNCK